MIRFLTAIPAALLVAACATPPGPAPGQPSGTAPTTNAAPATWEPAFWDRSIREAQQARAHGDRATAERACARGILYVQAQTIRMLYGYAETLDAQKYGSGVPARARAQKLEQARDEQAQARKSGGNTYLGFDPAAELKAYADLLANMNRNQDALAVEALAAAYQYAQGANLRRTLIQREGKDPLGEC